MAYQRFYQYPEQASFPMNPQTVLPTYPQAVMQPMPQPLLPALDVSEAAYDEHFLMQPRLNATHLNICLIGSKDADQTELFTNYVLRGGKMGHGGGADYVRFCMLPNFYLGAKYGEVEVSFRDISGGGISYGGVKLPAEVQTADAVILVYDVTNLLSYWAVERYLRVLPVLRPDITLGIVGGRSERCLHKQREVYDVQEAAVKGKALFLEMHPQAPDTPRRVTGYVKAICRKVMTQKTENSNQ